jgi:hypothetical protein
MCSDRRAANFLASATEHRYFCDAPDAAIGSLCALVGGGLVTITKANVCPAVIW